MKRIIIVFLVFCGVCFGVDILVPSGKASINLAIEDASTGDNIIVSTFTDTVQITLDAAAVNGKTLTVVADTGATVIVKPEDGWPISGVDEANSGNISFTNITFDTTFAGNARNEAALLPGDIDISFTNCTLIADDEGILAQTNAGDTTNRTITVSGGSITSGRDCVSSADGTVTMTDIAVSCPTGYSALVTSGTLGDLTMDGITGSCGKWLELAGAMSDLEVNNCNINMTNADDTEIGTDLTALGNVRFKDNTLTALRGGIIVTNLIYTGQVYLDGNTITLSAASATGLQVGAEMGVGGQITDWETATAYTIGNVLENYGRVYECVQAHTSGDLADEPRPSGGGAVYEQFWKPFKMRRAIVQNNDITMNAGATAHAMLIAVGPDNSVISANKTTGGNFGGVFKAEGLVIVGNKFEGTKPFSIFSLPSCYVANNTFVCTSGSGITLGDQDPTFTSDNYLVNNIVKQTAAAACMTDDGNTNSDGGDYINYNDYYRSDGGNIVVLSGNRANLIALTAQWLTQSEVFGDVNDQNSLVENPQLDSNYQSQNPDVLLAGKPDVNGNAIPMGGTMIKPTESNARARYR